MTQEWKSEESPRQQESLDVSGYKATARAQVAKSLAAKRFGKA